MGLAGLRVQERAAFKSVIQFFILFFSLSSLPEPASVRSAYYLPVLEITKTVGSVFTRELMICILKLSPRSAQSFLADLLFQLMSHYSLLAGHWLKLALGLPSSLTGEPNRVSPPCLDFDQLRMSETSRQMFVKQISGSRQQRKFKEAVKDFALKCRGLDGTAFAEIWKIHWWIKL